MGNANIKIVSKNSIYLVKIGGRATFEYAPTLKNFAGTILSENISAIRIDLSECTWMDSTFMGTLAILGLKSREKSIPVTIHKASEKNMGLIKELGINVLFLFSDSLENLDVDFSAIGAISHEEDMGRTMLDAHQTLIDINSQNAEKFDNVIDFIKKDIERKK